MIAQAGATLPSLAYKPGETRNFNVIVEKYK